MPMNKDLVSLTKCDLRRFTFKLLLIVCGLSLLPLVVSANDENVLALTNSNQPLAPFMQFLQENDQSLTALQALDELHQFSFNHATQLTLSVSEHPFWFRFVVTNPTSKLQSRILIMDYSLIRQLELYRVSEDSVKLEDDILLEESVFKRNIAFRSPSFEINLPAGESAEYLIRASFVGKSNHALEIRPRLLATSDFIQHQLILHGVFALLIGMLLALGIYNTIIYMRVGVTGHIYYSWYLFSYVLLIACYEGFIFYLPQPPPWQLVVAMMSIMPTLASISLISFGRHILQLAKYSLLLDSIFKWVSRSVLMFIPLTLLNLGWLNFTIELTVVVITVSLGAIAAIMPHAQYKASRYFAISFIFIAVGYGIETTLYSIPSMQMFAGVIDHRLISWIEQYFFYSCVVVEVFFLALALSTYIAQLREDKESAQKEAFEQLKSAAKMKQKYAESLEKTVEERTEALRQQTEEVEKARDFAEQASLDKSRFLATASHDLRQPLHSMGLFLDAINHADNDNERDELLQQLTKSLGSLTELFDALLDISKMDAASISIHKQPVALKSLFEKVVQDFELAARQKNLGLSFVTPDKYIETDPLWLQRILGNLLSNAIRYTQGGRILLSCRKRGNQGLIQVWDTGQGIAEDQQQEIFREFTQLHNPQRERSQGLGLGLAIVKRLCNLLGHDMTLRSSIGHGSVFSFSVEFSDANIVAEPVISEWAPKSQIKGKHILIIEDELEARNAMEHTLKRWGVLVQSADGLATAHQILDQSVAQPDIILSDYRLANNSNGVDVIAALQQYYSFEIPALIVTGDTDRHTLEHIRTSGIKMLHKPVKPAKLRVALNALLAAPILQ